MSIWQFLIQREGDQSWLPIEQGGEILEGRYRLAARTGQPNTSILIEVAYHSAQGWQARPRQQRRSSQTNDKGLVVLFPYSRLQAGSLVVRCQVTPSTSSTTLPTQQQWFTTTLHILEQTTATDWDEWDHPGSESALELPTTTVIPAAQIQLTSEALIITEGNSIQLEGMLHLTTDSPIEQQAWQGKLQVILRHPQTSHCLLKHCHIVQTPRLDQVTSLPFTMSLTVPTQETTHVLLGEICLYPLKPSPQALALASELFTVTTGLDDLLTVLSQPFGDEQDDSPEMAPLSPAELEPKPELDLTFMTMLNGGKEGLGVAQQQGAKAENRNWAAVQLPKVPGSSAMPPSLQAPPTATQENREMNNSEPDPTDHELALTELTDLIDHAANLDLLDLNDGVLADLTLDLGIHQLGQSDSPPQAPESGVKPDRDDCAHPEPPAMTIETEFRSLNLEQRFWTHVYTLIHDRQQTSKTTSGSDRLDRSLAEEIAEIFKTDDSPTEARSDISDSTEANDRLASQASASTAQADDLWLNQEIVAEDELLADRWDLSDAPDAIMTLPHLPEDQPIPTPDLLVAEGELIAGKSIPVRVIIPTVDSQLCVKLWLYDYQTRSVLGEPRWIVSFMPDGYGNLEALTYVTIPQGCLDVQIAAIACEAHTQRESYRVTVDRKVVPSDLIAAMADLLV